MEPIFLTCCICFKKSPKLKSSFSIFCANASASTWSMFSWAFSTRETTSPIPRILDAILSGWKNSKSSAFSPDPINLIGIPVIDFMESAAPPLASPSSLVRIIPVQVTASWNFCAIFTASWPKAASATKSISSG